MKCLRTGVAILSLLLWVGYVQGQTLLRAHFENDALNGKPNKDLSGSPVGDMLEYVDELASAVKIVPTTLEGKHALEFTNIKVIKPGWQGNRLSFFSVPTTFDKAFLIGWAGKSVYNFTGSDLYIDLGFAPQTGNVSWMPLVGLRVASGIIHAFPSGGKSTLVGQVDTAAHSVLVIIDFPKEMYKVSVFTPKKGLVGTVSGTLVNKPPQFKPGAGGKVFVHLNYKDPIPSLSRKYLIDSLSINRN